MKTTPVFCWLAISATANTNIFPVLTIAGKSYNNARISSVTPLEALIIHDGGGARVSLTNLPPELQRIYPYDAAMAAAYANEQKHKAVKAQQDEAKQQEALRQISAWRGEPKKMRILNFIGTSYFDKYSVEIESDGERTIMLINVPPELRKYLSDVDQSNNAIAVAERRLEFNQRAAEKALDEAPVSATGTAAYVAAAMEQHDRAMQMKRNVQDEAKRLKTMQTNLKTLISQGEKKMTFIASKTAKQYAGLDVWEYTRPNPEKKRFD